MITTAEDWGTENQERIEKQQFESRFGHSPSQLFLYDVTSIYFEGIKKEFGDCGYKRDKNAGKMQIVIGLLTDPEGVQVAVRVFKGNTNDP